MVEVYRILEDILGKEKANKIIEYVEHIVEDVKNKAKFEMREEIITKEVFYAEISKLEAKMDNLRAEVKEVKSDLMLEMEKLRSENRLLRQLIYFLIIINILAMTVFNREFIEMIKLFFKIGG